MRIVIVGATGRLGSAVVTALEARGHDVVKVSRRSGVDAYTGDGLAAAVGGADTLIDAGGMNDPDPAKVIDFFTTTTRNLTAAARAAGVKHYVAIGIVGTDGMQDSGYFRGKLAQEQGVVASGVPYTIARITQFFEFMDALASGFGDGDPLHVSDVDMQPLAVAEAGQAVADIIAEAPTGGMREVGGPETASVAEFVQRTLAAKGDARTVEPDADVAYFGGWPRRDTLVPGDDARLMPTRFANWLGKRSAASS